MKGYILSIVAAAIVCAIAIGFLGKKTAIARIAGMLCGILMTVTLVAPLRNISFRGIMEYFNGISASVGRYVEDGKSAAEKQTASIIKKQTEAYILDKANRMGLEISVEVELDDRNGSVPCAVSINGAVSPYAREQLAAFIADTLGIAKEKQEWK